MTIKELIAELQDIAASGAVANEDVTVEISDKDGELFEIDEVYVSAGTVAVLAGDAL